MLMILEPNAHIYNPSEEDIRADKYYSGWKIWTFRKLREIIFQSSQDDKIMNSGGNLFVVQIPPCYSRDTKLIASNFIHTNSYFCNLFQNFELYIFFIFLHRLCENN